MQITKLIRITDLFGQDTKEIFQKEDYIKASKNIPFWRFLNMQKSINFLSRKLAACDGRFSQWKAIHFVIAIVAIDDVIATQSIVNTLALWYDTWSQGIQRLKLKQVYYCHLGCGISSAVSKKLVRFWTRDKHVQRNFCIWVARHYIFKVVNLGLNNSDF